MPDWSLFWEQAWIGICGLTYIILIIAVVAGFFAAIIFGAMVAWEFIIEWWDDLQSAKREAERESLYKQQGGPW